MLQQDTLCKYLFQIFFPCRSLMRIPWMSRPSVTPSPLSCQYEWRAIAMRQKVENLHFSWPGLCWPLCWCCDHWPAPGHRGLQHLTLHCGKLVSTRQTFFRSKNTEVLGVLGPLKSILTWRYTGISPIYAQGKLLELLWMLEWAPKVQEGSVCLGFYSALTLAGPNC